MRISGSAAIAFAAATVVCTYGHAAGRAEEQLSLEQALKRAEDRSPLVRRARLERGIADAKRVGAGVLLPANPAVAAGFGGRNDTSGSVPPASSNRSRSAGSAVRGSPRRPPAFVQRMHACDWPASRRGRGRASRISRR
jgi:hypothetical protein